MSDHEDREERRRRYLAMTPHERRAEMGGLIRENLENSRRRFDLAEVMNESGDSWG
jgi:hypothetical protein